MNIDTFCRLILGLRSETATEKAILGIVREALERWERHRAESLIAEQADSNGKS